MRREMSLREEAIISKSPSQRNGAPALREINLRGETREQKKNLYDDVARQFNKAANLMELDPITRGAI